MAGELNQSFLLNNSVVQALGTSQLVYVLVTAQPVGTEMSMQMPLNFGLVLDRSGSMAGSKIDGLRVAVKLVAGRMSSQDVVSIVIFDDKADVLVPSQPIGQQQQLMAQISSISDRGGTEMSKGMRRGLEQIRQYANPDRVSRMLLLTDGETWGDEEQCKQIATECGQAGIPISAFGLGDEWNSDLLDAIASNSGGNSDFLSVPEKIMTEFERTLRSMQGTVVKNASLTLRLVPGVTPRSAWRLQPQISKLDHRHLSDRDVQIHLGDINRDTGQSILIELVMQPRNPGTFRIAQTEITYDVPSTGITGEQVRQDILLTLTSDPTQVQRPNPEVMNLVEKVSMFKLQTRALSEAQSGNNEKATQLLRIGATRLLEMGEADLAQTFEQEASSLEQGSGLTASGTKKLQYQTRKLTQRLDDNS